MTSEEMNRAMEFLIQHGAQLDLRLERLEKLHERDHELLAQVTLQGQRMGKMIEVETRRLQGVESLLEIESQRLARLEAEDRETKEQIRGGQSRHDELMQELRDRLDRMFHQLDRILKKF